MRNIHYPVKCFCIVFICLTVIISGTFAQDNEQIERNRHKIGFISGFGGQYGLNVSYYYHIYFFQAQYYYSLIRKPSWNLEILMQPQYNITRYRAVDNMPDISNGYEFGLNAAILIRKYLAENHFSLYAFLGSGPHYVSGTPERQSSGFIFSDNFFIGLDIQLINNLYLDIRPGFRHISNLGLQNPNGGLHSFVFSSGLLFIL
jgi:hypothetical protein